MNRRNFLTTVLAAAVATPVVAAADKAELPNRDRLRHEGILLFLSLPDQPRPTVGVPPTFFRLK